MAKTKRVGHSCLFVILALLGVQTSGTSDSYAQDSQATDLQAPDTQSDQITPNSQNDQVANDPGSNSDEYSQLSLEQLVNLVVTSPSKKEERYSQVAAALYVITADDIRRSGKTTIPELLRMVPGLTVAQIDSNNWAVSARGFTGVFANKLLVLLDGRSVYTPLYGGVFWNEVDTLLQDIERIEVIRGPGATLYGANAVNGVINIITKNTKDTQGVLASTGGGSEERFFADTRYGETVGDTSYRIYSKYFDRDASTPTNNSLITSAHDSWRGARGGFRSDTDLSVDDTLMFSADGYYSEPGVDFSEPTLAGVQSLRPETRYLNGANAIVKWARELGSESEVSVKGFYDHIGRDDVNFNQRRDTWELEAQHRLPVGESHDVLYGASYRAYSDNYDGSFYVDVEPPSDTVSLYTAFLQDEITLVPDHLKLTVGTKLEQYDLSGLEVLPSARLAWMPDSRNTIWTAFSRAVRSPQRFNQDGLIVLGTQTLPNGLPAAAVLRGDSDYDSETLDAYELGYRVQVSDTVAFDLATFYNNYDDLESVEPNGAPFLTSFEGVPLIELPFRSDNLLEGETYGGELSIEYRPRDNWRLVGSYSLLNMDLRHTKGSQDQVFLPAEERTPKNQATLRSYLELPYNLEWDSALRYMDSIPGTSTDSYIELDMQVAWRYTKNWTLSVVGMNLLQDDHEEFALTALNSPGISIERSVFGRVTYTFK